MQRQRSSPYLGTKRRVRVREQQDERYWRLPSWRVICAWLPAALACTGNTTANLTDDPQRCPTHADVAPIFSERCATCHAEGARGGFRVDSYPGLLGHRDDGSLRVQPGNPDSLLLRVVRGTVPSHPGIQIPADEQALLSDWVVACRAPYAGGSTHPSGWSAPGDSQRSHGLVLRADGYRPMDPGAAAGCRSCHGAALAGEGAASSCLQCHPHGFTGCTGCHGDETSPAPPRDLSGARTPAAPGVGAHRAHLTDGPLHKAYECKVCHVVPASLLAEGHVRKGGEPMKQPAPVIMKPRPGAEAIYSEHRTCANAYCHGPAVDANARNQEPRWLGSCRACHAGNVVIPPSADLGEAQCGDCHGLPPAAPHPPVDRCGLCHQRAVENSLPVPEFHANGTVDLGESTGCSGCHGDSTSPAPPRDLDGLTDPSRQTVGAHRAHLESPGRIAVSVSCTECHAVPDEVNAPGHLHAPPAIVFPPNAGLLARADGASPTYDPMTGRCTSVYCHGGGQRLTQELNEGTERSPQWNGGDRPGHCGGCHGVPPVNSRHEGATLATCHRCHPNTVASDGSILFVSEPTSGEPRTAHLDGIVN